MGFPSIYTPFISLILIGYLLARFAGLGSGNLQPLIRYLFLPVIIFTSISRGMNIKTIALIAFSGAAVTMGGKYIFSFLSKRTGLKASSEDCFPNVAYFTFPLLAFCFGKSGLGTASCFLIGSYISTQASGLNWKNLVKEPIIFAALAGFGLNYIGYRISFLNDVLNPIYSASFSMILIYLGTVFQPMSSLNFGDGLSATASRLIAGFAIASLIINLLSFGGTIAKTIMICALAPPGSPGGQLGRNSEKVGIIICIILMFVMDQTGWTPWSGGFGGFGGSGGGDIRW
ncbi:MAG: hypothetical protein HRU09_06750 [Oligoflexales bacterium]|nr:hypothetical protein [Oligoflexales bacterium]